MTKEERALLIAIAKGQRALLGEAWRIAGERGGKVDELFSAYGEVSEKLAPFEPKKAAA